jgi:hypothetical protein
MMKGEQQKIFHKSSNRKINAFISLLYPSNKIKFKISKSRTSTDFIHLWSIRNYIKKNEIKRFILVTDNASFHVSRKTKQFIENQLEWLTVIFLVRLLENLLYLLLGIQEKFKMLSPSESSMFLEKDRALGCNYKVCRTTIC